jgi:hypothetical protein
MKFDRFGRPLNGIRRNWATTLAANLAVLALPLSAAGWHQDVAEAGGYHPVATQPRAGNEVSAGQPKAEASPTTDTAPQAYVGSIGADKVVLELTASETGVTGRYFDHTSRGETILDGTVIGDDLILKSRFGDEVVFELSRTTTGFSGMLSGPGSRSLPVNLSLLSPDAISASGFDKFLTGLSLYERQRWSSLALAEGDARVIGTRTLREWHEPASRLSLLWIERGYPKSALDEINAELARAHWQRVQASLDCSKEGRRRCYEKSQLDVTFLSDDFVSFFLTVDGAIHYPPQNHILRSGFSDKFGLNFNARNGEKIDLEDLLYLGEGPVPEKQTDAWNEYRREIFPARIAQLLRKLHPKAISQQDDCNHFDPEPSWAWSEPTWFLTRKGVYLEKRNAYAYGCKEPAEWRTIPWGHAALSGAAGLPVKQPDRSADVLNFGQAAFARSDIARVSLGFDENGYSVLEIAVGPEAAKRLEAETIRLLNTNVTLALDSVPMASPRVIKSISEGKLVLGGWLGFDEAQAMAGQIICTMRLTTSQFDPANLAGSLPCKPKKK